MSQCPHCEPATVDFQRVLPAISGYRIERLLGEGGMGSVYLAQDETLGRRVAIKLVSQNYAQQPEAHNRFLREARSMATVEHAHIVRAYSFGELAGAPYMVMEYVEGESLADRIRKSQGLPVEEALAILRQVAEGLAAAWEMQIIHRDIKPSNILISKRNEVRVADFGLAKPLSMEGDATLSHTGMITGTPHYISPEQIQGHSVDFRSDVYSLGIVLYEMIAGERPFEGTTPLAVLAKQLSTPVPSPKLRKPEVPDSISNLINWMTQKDPEKRPSSYGEILQTIDFIRGLSPVSPLPSQPPSALESPLRRVLVALKSLTPILLLAMLVVALWNLVRTAPEPQEGGPAENSKKLVVAVAPFYGPDEDSAKEGRVMAALIEKTVSARLGAGNAKVIGIEDTKTPVRDNDAARALGDHLGAGVVIWGETFVLRGETEIQPYITMVPRKQEAESSVAGATAQRAVGGDPLDALAAPTAEATHVEATAPNQIELRKTGAAGVGDVVLILAGVHALYTEGDANKALSFFSQAPKTAETMRYRAQALLRLGKREESQAAVRDSVALDPQDAQSQGMIGDFELEAGRLGPAAAAYQAASQTGKSFMTRAATFANGHLYQAETVLVENQVRQTGYLLEIDLATGNVTGRFRMPGEVESFVAKGSDIEITYRYDYQNNGSITFSHRRFNRPVYYGLPLFRMSGLKSGRALAVNFMGDIGVSSQLPSHARFVLRTDNMIDKNAPKTFPDLEAALRAAMAHDPTQPWHLFFLGQTLEAEGRKDEAVKAWEAIFNGGFPGTPYYEYAWMANYFERLRQYQWADLAFAESLKRRKQQPQPIGINFLIERLINASFIRPASLASKTGVDPARAHLWLDRARELSGTCTEGDGLAAAVWQEHFRTHGDMKSADREAAFLQQARRNPFDKIIALSIADYSQYCLLSTTISFVLLLTLFLIRAITRARSVASNESPPRWPGLILPMAIAVPAVTIMVLVSSELLNVFLGQIASVWIAFIFALAIAGLLLRWKNVSFQRSIDKLSVVVACVLVAVTPYVMFIFRRAGRWEALLMAGGVFFALIIALLGRKGISPRLIVASFEKGSRGAISIALTLMLLSAVWMAFACHRLQVVVSAPIGVMDALGSDNLVRDIEARLQDYNAPETRYAAAVINHMAGNADRAVRLYESVSENERAKKNLAALQKAQWTPPEPLTTQDLYDAFYPAPLTRWTAPLLRGEKWNPLVEKDPIMDTVLVSIFQVTLAVGIPLVFAFLLIAPLKGSATHQSDTKENIAWMARIGFAILPGSFDVRRGHALRAYLLLLAFVLVFSVSLTQIILHQEPGGKPVLGLMTYSDDVPYDTVLPLPEPLGNLFWTYLFHYPYARPFFLLVVVSASMLLLMHAATIRSLLRPDAQ